MNTKKLLTIVGIVVAAIALFLAGFYLRPQYDKKQLSQSSLVAKSFVADVVNGKADDAYALTAKSLQDKQSKAEFEKIVATVKADKPELSAGQGVKSGSTYVYYQRASNLPASPSGSTNANFYLTLVKDGGSWKVATVSIE